MKHKTEDYKISAVKYYLKNTDSSDLPTAKMDIENYHVGPPNVIFFIVFQYFSIFNNCFILSDILSKVKGT
jgi:hypothetical protein